MYCTVLYCTVQYCIVLQCIPLQCRRCWLPSAPLFARRSGNSGYCSFKSGLGCGGPQSSGSRHTSVNYYLAIVSSSPVLDILHQPTNSIIDTPITRTPGYSAFYHFYRCTGERNKNLSIHICPLVAGLWAGHHTNCPRLQNTRNGGKQYLLLAFIVYKNICKLKHLIFLFLPKLMTLGSH